MTTKTNNTTNQTITLNFKIGVIKELHKKQLLTDKQMEIAIKLLQSEIKERGTK